MFKAISRPLLWTPSARYSHRAQRQFSLLAIHTSFPATLVRYSSKRKSNLYNRSARQDGGDNIYEDAVEVSANGLIGPKASDNWTQSNGALLMPNTFNMQELVRRNFDNYIDDEEAGKTAEIPLIYTVPKGTPVPSPLILFHEINERFSLQPSRQMLIEDLNERLDEFFTKHAKKQMAEEWIDNNDFNSAVGGDAVSTWMAK